MQKVEALMNNFSTMMRQQKGFTLLEILLVVAAIAVLAGIVVVAINPGKQLGDTRNAQRSSDVNAILQAANQYTIDNSGTLPATILADTTCPASAQAIVSGICKTGSASCTGLIDLTVLTTAQKYLTSLPSDPSGASGSDTGYDIVKSANGRITVCAPSAEQGKTISVTQ